MFPRNLDPQLFFECFDFTPQGILICDSFGHILHTNAFAHRELQYGLADWVHISLEDICFGQTRFSVKRFLDSLDEKSLYQTVEFKKQQIITKRGEILIYDLNLALGNGGRNLFVSLLPTERSDEQTKRQIEELKDSEMTWRQKCALTENILQSLPEPSLVVDHKGKPTHYNKSFTDLLGFNVQVIKQFFLEDQETPCPKEAFPLTIALKEKRYNQKLLFFKTKDRKFWCLISANPTMFENKLTGAVMLVRDVSEIIRQQQELHNSNRNLERFAAVAAHDLASPPRQIAVMAEMLEREPLSEKAQQYVELILRSASRMQNLVSSLLTFSTINKSKKPFAKVPLALLIDEVITNLQPAIKGKGAVIYRPQNLPTIWGDSDQIYQLFQNLLTNALKFSRKSVTPTVTITFRDGGEGIQFCVQDNGIGFSQEHAQKIFEVFRRLVGKSEYPGTGMGLAVCKSIIERHKGTIYAKGDLGKGATFIFTIPKEEGGSK